MFGVDHREVNDWSAGGAVRKDMVIGPQDCTRERLIALADYLALRFVINPVVVINVFDDERAAQGYDKQQKGEEDREFALAHWPARYLKSWARQLHELVIYPGGNHHQPERISFR